MPVSVFNSLAGFVILFLAHASVAGICAVYLTHTHTHIYIYIYIYNMLYNTLFYCAAVFQCSERWDFCLVSFYQTYL